MANRNADTVWVLIQEEPGEFNAAGADPERGRCAGRARGRAAGRQRLARPRRGEQRGDSAGSANVAVLLNDGGTGFSPPEGRRCPATGAERSRARGLRRGRRARLYVTEGACCGSGWATGRSARRTQVAFTGSSCGSRRETSTATAIAISSRSGAASVTSTHGAARQRRRRVPRRGGRAAVRDGIVPPGRGSRSGASTPTRTATSSPRVKRSTSRRRRDRRRSRGSSWATTTAG